MSFSEPLWLLALVAVPLVWWVHRRGVGAVGLRQRRIALWVRSVMVAAIVLALSGVALSLPDNRIATVLVADVSDSVDLGERDRADRFIAEALESKPADALTGIVAFGGDARVEMSLTDDPLFGGIASRPDPTRTDVARALRLAGALMPDGARRRIVLLSDGLQNAGDAELEAEALKRQGIVVDVVETSGVTGDDSAVVEVDVPSRVRVDDSFEIEATLSATTAMQGTLTLRRDGREVARREVSLEPGEQSFSFPGKAASAGSARRDRRADAGSA
ncbi:MAG: vWA domain-containing protein, partial [Actinomycetota bacterium]